jgi:peptide deformylase
MNQVNIRPILTLGHPVLRKIAKPIQDIGSQDSKQLIYDLQATAQSAGGVGIAAPQVGESLQLFIMASQPNARYPNAPAMTPTPIFNPKILSYGDEIHKDWEGCLSVPNIRGLVPRPNKVTVEYFSAQGHPERKTFEGFLARLFQHEFDHLIGLTFLDRVDDNKALMSDYEFRRQILKQ